MDTTTSNTHIRQHRQLGSAPHTCQAQPLKAQSTQLRGPAYGWASQCMHPHTYKDPLPAKGSVCLQRATGKQTKASRFKTPAACPGLYCSDVGTWPEAAQGPRILCTRGVCETTPSILLHLMHCWDSCETRPGSSTTAVEVIWRQLPLMTAAPTSSTDAKLVIAFS